MAQMESSTKTGEINMKFNKKAFEVFCVLLAFILISEAVVLGVVVYMESNIRRSEGQHLTVELDGSLE